MFTGLVEGMAPLHDRVVAGAGQRMTFDLHRMSEGVKIGDSIALSGCCLTVVALDGSRAAFELGSETLSRTRLGGLQIGQSVNCERSLQVGDRLGGHYVTGHVDALGTVVARRDEGPWRFLEFRAPLSCMRQMAPKGSVTIDGVSLTLVRADDEAFSVALIPHTLDATTLGQLEIGHSVHVETDVLAKYVARQLESLAQPPHRAN